MGMPQLVIFSGNTNNSLQGKPYGAYDKPVFTQLLDPSSSNKSPSWKDGFKVGDIWIWCVIS